MDVPVDTEIYIYGLGSDNSYSGAQKAALADIAQKISSRVSTQTEIKQRKEGNRSETVTLSNTQSYSRDIELPNFEVIQNENQNGLWNILIRVERSDVQRAIFHQLESLGKELSDLLIKNKDSYGPKCLYFLSKSKAARDKLAELIPVYLGSGATDQAEKAYRIKIEKFDALLARCEQANKFQLVYLTKVSRKFEQDVIRLLNKEGFEITTLEQGTGTIFIDLAIKQSFVYKNHLTLLTLKMDVVDEFKSPLFEKKLKVRGSSFRSKEDAFAKAQTTLIKKMKSLILAMPD